MDVSMVQCSHTIISMLIWISRWSPLCRWQWCFKYFYRLWGSKQRILLMNIAASKQRVNMRWGGGDVSKNMLSRKRFLHRGKYA